MIRATRGKRWLGIRTKRGGKARHTESVVNAFARGPIILLFLFLQGPGILFSLPFLHVGPSSTAAQFPPSLFFAWGAWRPAGRLKKSLPGC